MSDEFEFTHDMAEEAYNEAQRLLDAGDYDGARDVLRKAMAEAGELGAAVDMRSIDSLASYVQASVKQAIMEICATAEKMESDVVPVEFLLMVAEAQSTGAKQLYKSVEDLGVPLRMGIPDDLSGLDGLS